MSPSLTASSVRLAHRVMVVVLGAVVGVLAGLVASGGTALAHAELLEVVPADGSVLPEPPSGVTLRFSENISLVGGSARLLDDEGSVVADDATAFGDTVTLPLPSALADGTYTVAWEIVSADSHRITGASVFHVGSPSATEPVGAGTGLPWALQAGTTALMAVAYAAALLAVGLAWFATIVARLGPSEVSAWRDVVRKAGVLAVLALAVALPVRIARVGGGIDALGDGTFVIDALGGPIGVSTAITIAAVIVLVTLVGRRAGTAGTLGTAATPVTPGTPVTVVATAGVGIVALGGFAIEGHTRTSEPAWLMTVFDVIHLAAAAVWLGGIVGLVMAFRARAAAPRLTEAVRRFSTAAVGAVVVVAAAGVGMSLIVLPSPSDLWTTGYGVVLVTKVAIVAVVVGLGAYNRRRLVPVVDGGAAAGTHLVRDRLARIVRAELGLLLVVVAVTALLVNRSPTESEAAAAPPVPVGVEAPLSGDFGTVMVAALPQQTGYFETELELRDATGQPLTPAAPPTAQLREPAQSLGPLDLAVHEVGPGLYHVFGEVPVPGSWQLQIAVRATDFDEATAVLETDVT